MAETLLAEACSPSPVSTDAPVVIQGHFLGICTLPSHSFVVLVMVTPYNTYIVIVDCELRGSPSEVATSAARIF